MNKYARMYNRVITCMASRCKGPGLEKFVAPIFNITVYITPRHHYLCCLLLTKIQPSKYKMALKRGHDILP